MAMSVLVHVSIAVLVEIARSLTSRGPSPASVLQDSDHLEEPEPLLGGGVHRAPAPGLPPPGHLRAGRGHCWVRGG